MRVDSLFAGIGGFDIAAEARGHSTAWMVEWDPSCQHWLREHFPGTPILGDITTVNFTELERVDILCGGFPCPPVSVAGKQLGKLDDRWLWPDFRRAIRDLRPRYVVVENVPGLLSTRDEHGCPLAGEVLGDLAALGYDAEWEVLSAGDVGAPQERERIWIVAYASRVEGEVGRRCEEPDRGNREARGVGGVVGDTDRPYAERARVAGDLPRAAVAGDEPCVAAAGDPVAAVGDSARGGRRARAGLEVSRTDGARPGMGDAGSERSAAGLSGSEQREEGESGESHDGGDPLRVARAHRLRDWSDAVPVRGCDDSIRLIPAEAARDGAESSLWPVAPRVPGRVARLRAIGNAVVPLVAWTILGIIEAREAGDR